MAERFNLSENDRFTMLSGIAHDVCGFTHCSDEWAILTLEQPIQRDVLTPLFLGSTLLVPSKEDIMHEKLARWMAREGATVSHLTPAMGQILVGGVGPDTTITSFHHVGENKLNALKLKQLIQRGVLRWRLAP